MPTQKQIQTEITNRIRIRESKIDDFLAQISSVLGLATRNIAAKIQSSDNALEQVRLLSEFETILLEAGYADKVYKLRAIYADELIHILDDFAVLGVPRTGLFSGIDRQIIETLVNSDFTKLETTVGRYGVDLKAQMARSIIAGELINVEPFLETTLLSVIANAKTEVNTAVQGFNRAVTAKKAKDTFGKEAKFLYIGPEDSKTRDFCEKLLRRNPPIYSLREIEGMDNGQLSPVLAYGGGYNCRHQWRPVSDDLEKDLQNEV